MKQRTKEWIEKAEGDWKIAQREMKATDPVWDGVCRRTSKPPKMP